MTRSSLPRSFAPYQAPAARLGSDAVCGLLSIRGLLCTLARNSRETFKRILTKNILKTQGR
jgi:hypothetical protein